MQSFSMAKSWWQFLILVVVSYLLGCVNIARIIARKKHKDITQMGSGNPGTMNMSREFGWKVGLFTFIFDAIKGGVPVLVAHLIYKDSVFEGTLINVSDVIRYLCGLCAVLGHIFPATHHFRGGKGIATTFGVFWVALSCESAWYVLIVFGMFLLLLACIYLTQLSSFCNMITMAIFAVIQTISFHLRYSVLPVGVYMVLAYMLVFAFPALTWWAHRKNLLHLFVGTEHKTSLKKIVHTHK